MGSREQTVEALLETALAEGVFTETDEEHIQWSPEVVERRGQAIETLRDDANYERVHQQYTERAFDEESMITRQVLATAMGIREVATSIDTTQALLIAETFRRFERDEPTDGVPNGFVPIEGGEIKSFLADNPVSILFFWREDCPPCTTMKERLEALIEDGTIPETVGTASIYGPNYVSHIREQYQVAIAPTLLFCTNGRVDTRHIGETHENVLLEDLEFILGDLSGSKSS
jgi:thiol-disulfide isomerase/thioredoxin